VAVNGASKGLKRFLKVDTCVSGYVTDGHYKFKNKTVPFAKVKALYMYLE
jgi:hypothetical protein